MKVTVCELRNDAVGLEQDWPALVGHVRSEKSELVLLPEMAFHPWLAGTNQINPELWQEAVRAHDLLRDRPLFFPPYCFAMNCPETSRGELNPTDLTNSTLPPNTL
jgi:N-carbamoylputrescine amidase